MRKIIEEAWESYERQVIPQTAPQVQRIESRRAFYAGAIGTFYGLLGNVGSGDGPPTAEELAIVDGIHNELTEWGERMKRGEV